MIWLRPQSITSARRIDGDGDVEGDYLSNLMPQYSGNNPSVDAVALTLEVDHPDD